MSLMAIEPTQITTSGKSNPKNIIENDGWFPALSSDMLRDVMRLDGTITEARLMAATTNAMLAVNQQLAGWKEQQQKNGFVSLLKIPASQINHESQLLHHYHRAVFSTVKADLLEKYRSYDSTASSVGDKKSLEWLDNAPAEERRNAHWAIADIVGRLHMTVELI